MTSHFVPVYSILSPSQKKHHHKTPRLQWLARTGRRTHHWAMAVEPSPSSAPVGAKYGFTTADHHNMKIMKRSWETIIGYF